jgi:hypothetical protein
VHHRKFVIDLQDARDQPDGAALDRLSHRTRSHWPADPSEWGAPLVVEPNFYRAPLQVAGALHLEGDTRGPSSGAVTLRFMSVTGAPATNGHKVQKPGLIEFDGGLIDVLYDQHPQAMAWFVEGAS